MTSRAVRIVAPAVLGLAMLGVIVAAVVAPASGAVQATSSCQYGDCQTSTAPFPWIYVIVPVVAILVIAGAVLYLRMRGGGGSAGGGSGTGGGAPEPSALDDRAASTDGTKEAPPEAGPTEPYDESAPEPPSGGAPAAPAPSDDIDSLMDELDKLSGPGK